MEAPDLSTGSQVTFNDLMEIILRDAQAGLLPTHLLSMKIEEGTALGELGIDSLAMLSLLSAISDSSNKDLSAIEMATDETVESLLKAINDL